MAVYCISYDLKSEKYDLLIEAIKAYGCWWHQSKSTWFIESTQETKKILENLNNFLSAGDKIIVIQVHKNWWAAGHTDEEYKWMKERNF
jgi:CRISPR associated protein Cas2.